MRKHISMQYVMFMLFVVFRSIPSGFWSLCKWSGRNKSSNIPPPDDNQTGLGDVLIEPFLLSLAGNR